MATGDNGDPIFGDLGNVEPSAELAKLGLPIDDPAGGRATSGSAGDSTAGIGGDGSPRRRGRKPGSKNASKTTQSNLGLETLLFNIHNMLGMALQTPELALDKEEAKMLADSVAAVNSYYNAVVDAKTMAWINLTGTVAAIYGPRLFMLRGKFAKKRQKPMPNSDAPEQADVSPAPQYSGPSLVNMPG